MKNEFKECIDTCSRLLRGELSAVETYSQALDKFEAPPDARLALEGIRSEHADSVNQLSRHLRDMGAEPPKTSGAWGAFARAVEGTAKVFGKSPALAALREGEEHGQREYQEALAHPGVMPEIKTVIRERLLPPLFNHISTLQSMRGES